METKTYLRLADELMLKAVCAAVVRCFCRSLGVDGLAL